MNALKDTNVQTNVVYSMTYSSSENSNEIHDVMARGHSVGRYVKFIFYVEMLILRFVEVNTMPPPPPRPKLETG